MKTKILALLLVTIVSLNCTDKRNKVATRNADNMILADNGKVDENISYNIDANGKKIERTNYQYKATNGVLVKVIFDYEPQTSEVQISSNGKTYILEKVQSNGKITEYKKDDMKAIVQGDSLLLYQGKNIIELVKSNN